MFMLEPELRDLLSSSPLPTPLQRFWRFVKVQPNGCWLWCGAVTSAGYGSFKADGRAIGAHVFSYTMFVGPIPHDDLKVCHTCDVKRCVCPSHFYLGTHSVNVKDAYRTGARKRSSSRPKLTSELAEEVRQAEGTQRAIANAFGVSIPLVRAIKSGKVWDREKRREQLQIEVPF